MNEQINDLQPSETGKRPSDFPFQLFRIDNTSFEFPAPELLPQELQVGGICLCLHGECNMTLNQQRCQIKAGDLCVFLPRMQYQISEQSDDFEAFGILTQAEIMREVDIPSLADLLLYIGEHPCISLDETTYQRIIGYFRLIDRLTHDNHPYCRQIVYHQLMILYYEVSNIFQQGKPLEMPPQTRQEAMFRQFIAQVSRHHILERELGYYADKLCVTPKYLSSVVRSVTGKSAAWWIRHTVIIDAKNLLKSSQLTIQQVSDELHFPNPSFFGQYFKRQTGMTPKEFRRKSF